MRVAIGSDHAGFDARQEAIRLLRKRDIEVIDMGPEEKSSVDYADFAHRVARAVAGGEVDLGVLVCGTGLGMSMSANRHVGVRAAVISNEFTAEMARAHNDANVACFGERVIGVDGIAKLLAVFLDTDFDGDRHTRRVEKIEPNAQQR